MLHKLRNNKINIALFAILLTAFEAGSGHLPSHCTDVAQSFIFPCGVVKRSANVQWTFAASSLRQQGREEGHRLCRVSRLLEEKIDEGDFRGKSLDSAFVLTERSEL